MHILSKVLIWIIAVAAAGAGYLTIDLAKKQDEWLSQIVKLKQQRDKNNEDLRKVRINHDALQSEATRQMDQWGRQWQAGNSGPLQGDPGVQVGVGSEQGLGKEELAQKKPLPTVYVFANADQEQSRYLGDFELKQIDNNRAGGLLTREPYPGEAESWQPGVYRARQSIPEAWKQIFIDLHTQQTLADQQIVDEEAKLAIQDKHIAESQATLNQRLAELNGDPAAPEKAAEDVKVGLVESIRRNEVLRNQLLKDVDTLRRSISDNYATLVDVLAKNREKVEAMSSASSATTPPQTAARPGN